MSSTTSSSFGMPVSRRAARLSAASRGTGGALIALAALAGGTAPAHATGDHHPGKADAVVLRAGLDVSLLDKTVRVPVNAALNDVHAPRSAAKTALSVRVGGAEQGRPVEILRADAATARATADDRAARGYANLLHAKVHVPGLPLLSLIEVQQVTSEAVCRVGQRPTATANLLGSVSVLGKKVTLRTGGTTDVDVPGVGRVRLDLSKTVTTSRTGAATALELAVDVNPLKLNVAEVHGRVTLVRAGCETPSGGGKPAKDAPAPAKETPGKPPKDASRTNASGTGVKAQTVAEKRDLAETGGSSATPWIAGAAGLLVVGGGGALVAARRRTAAARGRD
ncbi:SCO1860 family LAETG-anchored protein [Streptomyces sp. I05A-00742]|uniref:SCO1860 family LAETG-anchored protein n=1 Tax=Streptomyces sp. I05A-00742 TaxID=2732853 RepID=UPI0014886333|nr:SCO1860 family LAETG-anchored protein [Streptomyces sp. I05A-00742]